MTKGKTLQYQKVDAKNMWRSESGDAPGFPERLNEPPLARLQSQYVPWLDPAAAVGTVGSICAVDAVWTETLLAGKELCKDLW